MLRKIATKANRLRKIAKILNLNGYLYEYKSFMEVKFT